MKKKSKNLLIGCSLFTILCGLALFVLLAVGFKACSDGCSAGGGPYGLVMDAAANDPRVSDALGGINQVGALPSGSINYMNGGGHADLTLSIDGVDRDGTYLARVEKPAGGEWAIVEASLVIEDGNEVRLDPPVLLTAPPAP